MARRRMHTQGAFWIRCLDEARESKGSLSF